MSTEAKELDLCGKVEMRIALAKDEKLESILKPYLAPLLLKLASEHVSVRNKVSHHTHMIWRVVDICRLFQYVNMSKYDLPGTRILFSQSQLC